MNTVTVPQKQSNSIIDIMKFVLALLIAALHAKVDIGFLFPLYRIAVPLFFITSGYFLFGKLALTQNIAEKKAILRKSIIRNLQLYLFWFIVLLPVTLNNHTDWFSSTPLINFLSFMKALLFGSTFAASWYITATIIGTIIVFFLSQKFHNRILLGIGLAVYFICCMLSNYYEIFRGITPIGYAYTAWLTLFGSFVNSFPASIFWLILGKYFAETPYTPKRSYKWIALTGFLTLLAEHFIIQKMGWVLINDCYLMLIPVCYALFQFLRQFTYYSKFTVRLRNMSTIIYTLHFSVIPILQRYLHTSIGIENPVLNVAVFAITISICLLVSILIFTLEKKKYFHWLRYAH